MALPQDDVLAFLKLDVQDQPFDVLARLEANEAMWETLQAEIDAGGDTPEMRARQKAIEALIDKDFHTLIRISPVDR